MKKMARKTSNYSESEKVIEWWDNDTGTVKGIGNRLAFKRRELDVEQQTNHHDITYRSGETNAKSGGCN